MAALVDSGLETESRHAFVKLLYEVWKRMAQDGVITMVRFW